jgi:hypothetical protein
MKRFFRWYQFIVPLALFPASYLLWLRRYDGNHALVLLALSLPVVFAYVVPGLGTNWLGLWEINTRFRVGRFRPHHGFVFGTATSLFGLVCVPEAAAGFSLGDCLRAALVTGSVIGFWNWLYDIYAIKSGFITIYTKVAAEGQPAEVVATSHAPVYFGVFGTCYGVCLQLVDALSVASHRGMYVALMVVGTLAAVVLPVLAYVLWSFVTQGESGLKAYRPNGGRHDELERHEVELVPVDRLRVPHPGRVVAES